MRIWRKRLASLALVGAVMFTGACGDDDKPTAAGDDEVTTTAPDDDAEDDTEDSGSDAACDIVSKADVQAAIGTPILQATDASAAGARSCGYTGDPASGKVVNVTVSLTPGDENGYNALASTGTGGKSEAVSGVGEKATLWVNTVAGSSTYTLFSLKGSTIVTITVTGQIEDAKAKSAIKSIGAKAAAKA